MKNLVFTLTAAAALFVNSCGNAPTTESSPTGDENLANTAGPALVIKRHDNQFCLTWLPTQQSVEWKKCADQSWLKDAVPATAPEQIMASNQIWTINGTKMGPTVLYQNRRVLKTDKSGQKYMGSQYMAPILGASHDSAKNLFRMKTDLSESGLVFQDKYTRGTGIFYNPLPDRKGYDEHLMFYQQNGENLEEFCLASNMISYGLFFKVSRKGGAPWDYSGCANTKATDHSQINFYDIDGSGNLTNGGVMQKDTKTGKMIRKYSRNIPIPNLSQLLKDYARN